MIVEIWVGLPYNSWYFPENLPYHMPPGLLFKNFRIRKGNFFLQIITESSGETRVMCNLPYGVEFSI